MFSKFILATVLIAFASSNAFAEEKKKAPLKPKIETSKTLEDDQQMLQFEIQSATSDQQQAKPKPDKLGKFEIQPLMQN